MAFEAFRQYGGPTFYESVHIPVEGDLLTSGLIFCLGIVGVSFFIILPGLAGKEKAFSLVRITVSMFIGGVILVSNFAMSWETAQTHTVTKYRAGTGQNVNVTIGVNIGFRGINITLKGKKDQIIGETINYNENFNWEGLQGRQGFGPFAGQFNKQYRAAQLRGVPLPILAVAEYFTIDGEGIRWGRFYRQAGWYSHIALWIAFPLWILSNILFFVLLRYGAYFLAFTGLTMITTNVIWATLRSPTDLKIQFTPEDVLVFSYGSGFWICLITGIVCVLLGIVIFLADKLFPTEAAVFFNVDVLQDSENILVEDEEEEAVADTPLNINEDAVDSRGTHDTIREDITEEQEEEEKNEDDDDAEGLYRIPPPPRPVTPSTDPARALVLRPKTQGKSFRTTEHRLTKRLQRPRRRDPPSRPLNLQEEGGDGDYVNAPSRISEPGAAAQRVTFGSRLNQNPVALYQSVSSTSARMTGYEKI